jgi:hypothetical protein
MINPLKNESDISRNSNIGGVGMAAYFVGDCDLERTVTFPIDSLSDKIIQTWLQGMYY